MPGPRHREIRAAQVRGADGTRLHVQEAGDPAAPAIVLLHGFAQSSDSWRCQLTSSLTERYRVIAPDLRGHGHSGKPPDGYDDPRAWAGDMTAVFDQLAVTAPVVAGWSYGGLVLCDYLAVTGEDNVAGYCFAGAITSINVEHASRHIGPEFGALIPALLGGDPGRRNDADRQFARLCTAAPRSAADMADALEAMRMCPRQVRQALFRRTVDHAPMLRRLRRPSLIVHGSRDKVVLASASLSLAESIPVARPSFYPDSGHMAFAEEPPRFNSELRAFADSAYDERSKADKL